MKQIAQLYLAAVHRQMTRQSKRLTITEAAINRLVDQGIQPGLRRALPQTHHRRKSQTADHESVESVHQLRRRCR